MRSWAAILVACLVVGGACTDDESGGTGATEVQPPQPPPHVRPPKIEPQLTASSIRDCLYPDPIDISQLAGRYFGPIDFMADQVSVSRELDYSVPPVDMVDPTEFKQRAAAIVKKADRLQRRIDLWLEWSLAYIPSGTGREPYSARESVELVAGYYDPAAVRIVVKEEGVLDAEYVILAHELAHAAADQAFGFPKDKTSGQIIDDSALALSSVLEGDATLTEMRVASRFTPHKTMKKALVHILQNDRRLRKELPVGTPHALAQQFIFPYRWGLRFVCRVFQKRGWKGVNRLYDRPPTSTAEIMFPDRYLKGEKPKRPPALGELSKPWTLYADAGIGAAHLKSLFEAPASIPSRSLSRPFARAAGWSGGRYEVWARGERKLKSVLGIALREHRKFPGLLCSSMVQWFPQAFLSAKREVIADRVVAFTDSRRSGVISCEGRSVRIGIAPTQDLAEAMIGGVAR